MTLQWGKRGDNLYIYLSGELDEHSVAEVRTFQEFITLYNHFLEVHNLASNPKLYAAEENLRYFEMRISSNEKVLWKQNRRLRYYDMSEYDFTELMETLRLERYRNTELSSEKFVRDYTDYSEEYQLEQAQLVDYEI